MPPSTAAADLDLVQQAALQTALLAAQQRPAFPPDAVRLEVRPSRGSDPDAPGTWRFRYRRRWHTLGLPGDRPEQEARDAARLAILCEEARRRGMIAPQEVPIAAVVENARREWKPDTGASRRDWETYQNYDRSLGRIERHYPGKLLADITNANHKLYLQLTASIRDRRFAKDCESPTISRATAHRDLVHLRMALKLYAQHARLSWMPRPDLPPAPSARHGFFTREVVARMLMACRGYVIDPATGAWKTVTEADPETGLARTRLFRHDTVTVERREIVRRLILIGVYSGTRLDAATNLSWRLHPNRGCIDVDRGLIHRAGYAEDVTQGKPRLTSALRPQLLVHLRGWRKRDLAQGIRHVTYHARGDQRGQPYRYFPYYLWWQVMADAGLDENADPHVTCHTAVTWLALDGYDLFVTADLTGRDPQTVRKVYRQWNLTGQRRAVTVGRLPVAKHVDVEDLLTDDRPRRADRYTPRGRGGKHKPSLPRTPKRRDRK
ncbi:UNVERIFIED_ORG: hypothetical protein J2W75_002347 [Methylorubrum zatmanii]|uniref:hypothetical protein n=1 Tax=Methylorubrum extorquens TaxID=408 RepID=UPI00209D46E0|nr:hypothetical protein [Methylorubrum extorquens]MCP1558836.1 hypothetical protein [Methylorubrum extorquens]